VAPNYNAVMNTTFFVMLFDTWHIKNVLKNVHMDIGRFCTLCWVDGACSEKFSAANKQNVLRHRQ
jgi:hypothetical protein